MKAIISVSNDLANDQRVHKLAESLLKFGYTPVLLGVRRKNSQKLAQRKYKTKRLRLPFHKGFLFYASYNIHLFFYLLFHKANVLISNDLDSLPANYSAYKIKVLLSAKSVEIVYDSHELFTEVPELYNRKFVKNVWLKFEQFILPKLKKSYTVCRSIADYYNKKYNIEMYVVKNMPLCSKKRNISQNFNLKLPENHKIILYQGALNVGRGIEQIIEIMPELKNVVLLIVGKGDIEHNLQEMVKTRKLQNKVIFTGSIPFEQLSAITMRADIGLVLQQEMGLSYHYALPNRLFDFIQAKVAVLASNQPEIKNIVNSEKIGLVVENLNKKTLLTAVNQMINNDKLISEFKANMQKCAHKYCWESQEKVLRQIYCSTELD